MTPSLQIGLSFALTFGVPSAIGVWELWRLRRDEPPPWRWDPESLPPSGPPPAPQSVPVREGVLEDA